MREMSPKNITMEVKHNIMLYVKDTAGELIPITYEGVFAKCPGCGAIHQVDISEIMESCGGDVEDASVYCAECSERHLPMFERMDEIEFVASRFPSISVGQMTDVVKNGLDRGLSFDTALAGARVALAEEAGCGSLYTLDEVASALGCTNEVAERKMEELGISPIKTSALPGAEMLISDYLDKKNSFSCKGMQEGVRNGD